MSKTFDLIVFWTLYAELWFLLLLEALLCLWFIAWVWFIWSQLRDARRFRAEARVYGAWCCPNCHEPYGALERWFTFDWNSIDEKGEPFANHVGLWCRKCSFSTRFDVNGRPNLLTMHHFEPGPMAKYWPRWAQSTEGWKCPHCGEPYQRWTGHIRRGAHTDISGPIMKCASCGTEAWIIEYPEKIEYACVRVPPRTATGES
jgi:hypothetical protein